MDSRVGKRADDYTEDPDDAIAKARSKSTKISIRHGDVDCFGFFERESCRPENKTGYHWQWVILPVHP